MASKKQRKSIRLKGYDYTLAGAYFVTICVKDRQSVLGVIRAGEMQLSVWGEIVSACWHDLPNHYEDVLLDAFVVMPNHVHGIVILIGEAPEAGLRSARTKGDRKQESTDADDVVGAGLRPAPTTATDEKKMHGLPEIVRAFKSFSARRINEHRGASGAFWQRNYYERIVRNERSLEALRTYIYNNPAVWDADQLHPDAPPNRFNQA